MHSVNNIKLYIVQIISYDMTQYEISVLLGINQSPQPRCPTLREPGPTRAESTRTPRLSLGGASTPHDIHVGHTMCMSMFVLKPLFCFYPVSSHIHSESALQALQYVDYVLCMLCTIHVYVMMQHVSGTKKTSDMPYACCMSQCGDTWHSLVTHGCIAACLDLLIILYEQYNQYTHDDNNSNIHDANTDHTNTYRNHTNH